MSTLNLDLHPPLECDTEDASLLLHLLKWRVPSLNISIYNK